MKEILECFGLLYTNRIIKNYNYIQYFYYTTSQACVAWTARQRRVRSTEMVKSTFFRQR